MITHSKNKSILACVCNQQISASLFRAERASRSSVGQEAAKKQSEEELRRQSEQRARDTAAKW
jgi:hypothetical protein